jgi:hypothetical protein
MNLCNFCFECLVHISILSQEESFFNVHVLQYEIYVENLHVVGILGPRLLLIEPYIAIMCDSCGVPDPHYYPYSIIRPIQDL